ncbi:galactose mutarotase-like domain-containing protein, partial [Blyttiomyces helicus]
GGGPLISMIERLRRMSNVEGLPATVKFGTPSDFYKELEATSHDLPAWKGELYFELHRGTYTSQAQTKKGNRKSELLLRDVEILASLCTVDPAIEFKTPKKELDRMWKLVLLNQFHDVLPGSSIEIVYDDALKFYRDVSRSASAIRDEAFDKLVRSVPADSNAVQGISVYNATSWARTSTILEVDLYTLPQTQSWGNAFHQLSADGSKGLALVEGIPAFGVKHFGLRYPSTSFSPVKVATGADGSIVVNNDFIQASFDVNGRLYSYVDKRHGNREIIAPGMLANVLKLFEDIPLFWDAWDVEIYHLEKGWNAGVGTLSIEERGPLRAVLRIEHPITPISTLVQKIIITAVEAKIDFETWVDWNENRKFLKVEFPFNIMSDVATYETQFGIVSRPTHYNNSWDLARFEVCGHKFADFSEHGYGVAVLNDCKYGYAVHDNVMRLSLLRSPKAPDLNCDMVPNTPLLHDPLYQGEHTFKYALYPHGGTFAESDVVQKGYELNVPLLVRPTPVNPANPHITEFFSVSHPNLVLDTIKPAEDESGTLILRLYESQGGRGVAHVKSALRIVDAVFCNVLEDAGGELVVPFAPFKIVSIRVKAAKA